MQWPQQGLLAPEGEGVINTVAATNINYKRKKEKIYLISFRLAQ